MSDFFCQKVNCIHCTTRYVLGTLLQENMALLREYRIKSTRLYYWEYMGPKSRVQVCISGGTIPKGMVYIRNTEVRNTRSARLYYQGVHDCITGSTKTQEYGSTCGLLGYETIRYGVRTLWHIIYGVWDNGVWCTRQWDTRHGVRDTRQRISIQVFLKNLTETQNY